MVSYKVLGVNCLYVGYCNKVSTEIVLVPSFLFMEIHTTINYLKIISIDWLSVHNDVTQSRSGEILAGCLHHIDLLLSSQFNVFFLSHHKCCVQFVTLALNRRDFYLINTKSCFQTLQRLSDICSSRVTFICKNNWQEVFDAYTIADTQTGSWSECMTFFLQSSYDIM